MKTILVPPEVFELAEIQVSGDRHRHLFRAGRVAVGEVVRVVDGEGRARWGEVAAVDRRVGTVRLAGPAPENEPDARVELLVSAPRSHRASWLVEKATELGVAAVRLLQSGRSPRNYGPRTLERLRRVAAAAVEQSGRSRLPAVTGMHAWGELGELLATFSHRRFLDPSTRGGWPPSPGGGAVAILVGPEGGWSESEGRELRSLGCRPSGLGARILRVETAAVVAVALTLIPSGGGAAD